MRACMWVCDQLENRLVEAEKVAEERSSELEAVRKQLTEEQTLREAAEAQVKGLNADVAAAKADAEAAAAQLEEERAARAAAESQAKTLAADVAAVQAGAGDAAAAEAALRAKASSTEEQAANLAAEKEQLAKKLQQTEELVAQLQCATPASKAPSLSCATDPA